MGVLAQIMCSFAKKSLFTYLFCLSVQYVKFQSIEAVHFFQKRQDCRTGFFRLSQKASSSDRVADCAVAAPAANSAATLHVV